MSRLQILLRYPLVSGLIVFALLLGSAAGIVGYVAYRLDREAMERESASIRNAFSKHAAYMADNALTGNTEKETLESLARGDYERIHHLIGKPMDEDLGFEFVYITDATGKLIYSSEFGKSGARHYFENLLQSLTALTYHVPDGGAGVAMTDQNDATILVVQVFRQSSPLLKVPQPLRIYVGDQLDQDLLQGLSSAAQTRNLRLADADADGRGVLTVPQLQGEKPVALAWQAHLPGRNLFYVLLPVLTLVSSAFALLFFILMLRYRRALQIVAEKEAIARRISQTDPLTHLANRDHFLCRFELALDESGPQHNVALLFVDLDAFKDINDTNGHSVGDQVLREVGGRLATCVGEKGCAARFGGDEFILFVYFRNPKEIEELIASIFTALSRPVSVENEHLRISVSIGAAHAPEDGKTSEELLRRADIALYRAKAEGRDTCRMFQPEFERERQELRRIETELLVALEKEQLILLYQPQVDVETERVTGFEALVRWEHPERGLILPDEFIPIAERSGLIHLIDAYVLPRACKGAQDLPGVTISVNMSPLDLRYPHLVENITQTLKDTGLDPSRLELELTESAILGTGSDSMDLLAAIRALGVRLALDDFGTGHASLVHVRRFPINKIKIDKSFIFNLGLQREAASIVEYVIHLGRSLGVTLTAEGVETQEQLRFLRAHGAHQAQGYLFAPPLRLEDAIALLKQQEKPGTHPNWPTSPSLAAHAPGTREARAGLERG